ncbi:MAG: RNA polymerase sigma factor [Janthinobacterium lividum]
MATESTKALREKQDARDREAVRIYYETGSERALGPLLESLRPRLKAFLRSMGVVAPDLLDEVTQWALVDLLKALRNRLASKQHIGNFFALAATCAWTAFRQYRRRELRHGQPSSPGSQEDPFLLVTGSAASVEPQEESDNAEEEARASELIKAATKAVMSLDTNARNAVVLHFYHGLSAGVASQQLGINRARFLSRLSRGLEGLREWGTQQTAPTAEIYAALSRVNTGDLFREPDRQTI